MSAPTSSSSRTERRLGVARAGAVVWLAAALVAAAVPAGASAKPRLAVASALVGPSVRPPAEVGLDAQDITRALEEVLRASRRFRVLERDPAIEQRAVESEQERALSERTAEEGAELGKLANADVTLLPFVSRFAWRSSFAPLDGLPGHYRRTDRGELAVTFKVLSTTTGELRYQVTESAERTVGRGVVESRAGRPSRDLWRALVDEVARKGGTAVVEALAPAKVVASEKGEIFVNRGEGSGVEVGQVWGLFSVGRELVDEDTGDVLGSVETPIGRVRIVRVTPRFSVARPVGSLAAEVEVGDVLRRPSREAESGR